MSEQSIRFEPPYVYIDGKQIYCPLHVKGIVWFLDCGYGACGTVECIDFAQDPIRVYVHPATAKPGVVVWFPLEECLKDALHTPSPPPSCDYPGGPDVPHTNWDTHPNRVR